MKTRWIRPVILAGMLATASAVTLVARPSAPTAAAPMWLGSPLASAAAGAGVPSAPSLLEGDTVPDIVVSPGTGGVASRVLDGVTLGELGSGFPFGPGFGTSVMTATGELSGDAIADIAVGMGPGGGLVRLYNGQTIGEIGSGYPFGPGFGGGVSLAVGDLNGDGRADIATGQASGGGTVRVFSGTDYTMLLSQAPFGDGFSGGVNVAAADVDGDGRAELIVAQASGGGLVAVISGATHTVTASGAPYGALPGGVFVAAADVNGDGRADVITAPGSGSGAILVYDINTLSLLASFAPYGTTAPGGVRVAASDLTGDGRAEIITVPGPGRPAELKIFSGASFALLSTQLAFPAAYTGGAFVSIPKSRVPTPNPGAPGVPTNLQFTVLGGTVELRWGPPATGGAPTNYRISVGSARGLSDVAVVDVGNVNRFVTVAPTGVFFVRVAATNGWGAGPATDDVVIVPTPTLGTGEFSATLTWDTQTDIDLHLLEPSGYHIFYRDASTRRGPTVLLDADNTLGYGPENVYTDRPAAAGVYDVYVVPYAGQADRWPTTAQITIRTNVGTPAEGYRVFRRTFTEPNTVLGYNVATVTFPGGIITETTGTRAVAYDQDGLTIIGGKRSKP